MEGIESPFEGLESRIAKITDAEIGYEDHGIFALNVSFEYGGTSQSMGNYCVCSDGSDKNNDKYGIRLVKAICDAAGVDSWSKVVGRTVVVYRDHGWSGLVRGMGPLPTEKGKLFRMADVFEDPQKEAFP